MVSLHETRSKYDDDRQLLTFKVTHLIHRDMYIACTMLKYTVLPVSTWAGPATADGGPCTLPKYRVLPRSTIFVLPRSRHFAPCFDVQMMGCDKNTPGKYRIGLFIKESRQISQSNELWHHVWPPSSRSTRTGRERPDIAEKTGAAWSCSPCSSCSWLRGAAATRPRRGSSAALFAAASEEGAGRAARRLEQLPRARRSSAGEPVVARSTEGGAAGMLAAHPSDGCMPQGGQALTRSKRAISSTLARRNPAPARPACSLAILTHVDGCA